MDLIDIQPYSKMIISITRSSFRPLAVVYREYVTQLMHGVKKNEYRT